MLHAENGLVVEHRCGRDVVDIIIAARTWVVRVLRARAWATTESVRVAGGFQVGLIYDGQIGGRNSVVESWRAPRASVAVPTPEVERSAGLCTARLLVSVECVPSRPI